jgi:hypothetical protein
LCPGMCAHRKRLAEDFITLVPPPWPLLLVARALLVPAALTASAKHATWISRIPPSAPPLLRAGRQGRRCDGGRGQEDVQGHPHQDLHRKDGTARPPGASGPPGTSGSCGRTRGACWHSRTRRSPWTARSSGSQGAAWRTWGPDPMGSASRTVPCRDCGGAGKAGSQAGGSGGQGEAREREG